MKGTTDREHEENTGLTSGMQRRGDLSCLACDGADLRRVRRYRLHTAEGRAILGGASLHECGHCGLVQAVPRPSAEQLEEYYSLEYRRRGYAGADVADLREFPRDNLFYYNRGESAATILEPFLESPAPKVLDIGAGYGHILHSVSLRFPESSRYAIEFSDVCLRHLSSIGVQVLTQPVEQVLDTLEERFDLVVLSHVLEHLLRPDRSLEQIAKRLAPRGVLYVEVPNIPAESLRRYPDHIWAPRYDEPHISFFSVATLTNLLERCGYEILFCDTAGPVYRFVSSLRYRLPPLRWFLQGLTPRKLFLRLRSSRITRSLRVQDREPSFYEYGGNRIWIRCVARPKDRAVYRPVISSTGAGPS